MDDAAPALPPGTALWTLASRRGNEVICAGVAGALGVEARVVRLAPRRLFERLAPWGPVDPADRQGPPFPDIALASGRAAVPYLRDLKRRSPETFAVFLQDPRAFRSRFDLIWAPAHDRLVAANAFSTLTSPHPISLARLAQARAAPPAALAALAAPRLALLVGGDSRHHRFAAHDIEALGAAAAGALAQGWSVMATTSRRTPPELAARLAAVMAQATAGRGYLWDGSGDNPYVALLACADAILVTGDSANMVGEAAASGAPVHVYEPSGGSTKLTAHLEGLIGAGAARRWRGAIESWRPAPIDATPLIAAEIARHYAVFREHRRIRRGK